MVYCRTDRVGGSILRSYRDARNSAHVYVVLAALKGAAPTLTGSRRTSHSMPPKQVSIERTHGYGLAFSSIRNHAAHDLMIRYDTTASNVCTPTATVCEPYIALVKRDLFRAAAIRSCAELAFPQCGITVHQQGMDALQKLRVRPAWLGLVGLTLPDIDGLDLIAIIHAESLVSRLVVVTTRSDEHSRAWLRRVPICGFFDCMMEDPLGLTEAIRCVAQGGSYFSRSWHKTDTNRGRLNALLTPTEMRVFSAIADGGSDSQSAERLGMKPQTVRTHREHIMRKLDLHSRGELIAEALRRGVVRVAGRAMLRPGFDLVPGLPGAAGVPSSHTPPPGCPDLLPGLCAADRVRRLVREN